MLKSEFLDAELLAITSEVQRLVEQRRSPTLHMTYQEQWDSLQTRGSEFLSFLSQKCNKIHKVAAMHYATLVHTFNTCVCHYQKGGDCWNKGVSKVTY